MELIQDYECTCRPKPFHTTNCEAKQIAQILQKMESLKKNLSEIRNSKHGNSEIYQSGKLYHYSITLTGHNDYTKILKSIKTSKMFDINSMCWGEEQNENDKAHNLKHIHLLVRSKKYIDSKEIYVKNKKKRVDVKLLRNKINLTKWHRYIHKETTFGDCCVDTTKAEIIIYPNNNAQDQKQSQT